MTRHQAKMLLPIIQAFADGKAIQAACYGDKWVDIKRFPISDLNVANYRIKPEPKYRPFKSAEECWQEMRKHQPFGWIKDKNDGHYSMVTTVDAATGEDNKHIGISGSNIWTLSETMCDYTFADGTPFGIKEED